jgi:EmrB/QacA subfamily drug resistance transporter
VSLGVLAVGLDGTVLTVALPTLAKALHASESDLQWFTSGYFLVLAAAMLPAGLLGDRYGHKKVLTISLGLFGLGSMACAYSASVGEFLAARVVLGLAGAGVVVMAISALTVLFTPEERPKAVGIWAAANFLSLPVGPILGGWMLSHFWWGWVFLINAPVAALGVVALITLVPESRAAQRPGFDVVGVVLSVAGLVSLTYGLIEAGQQGWGDATALLAMVAGVAVLVGFGVWERRVNRRPGGQPLLDLGLFGSASFTWGVLLAALAVLAMIGVLFTMPQYFQGVIGTDAMGSGLRLLPVIFGLVLGAIPAERIVRLAGAKLVAAAGFLLLAIGLFAGSTTSITSSTAFVAIWMAVAGLGPIWHSDSRQCAELRLPVETRPDGPAGGSRERCQAERLRRRRGGAAGGVDRVAALGAQRIHRRHGHRARGLGWDRGCRARAHLALPAAEQCVAGESARATGQRA